MLGEGLAGELAKGSCRSDAAASMAATSYSTGADLQLMHVLPIACHARELQPTFALGLWTQA